ncbi:MAG TPA: ABC transporter ATP-binding protein, partial [Candidatus Hydrogenedentes bacterium]|nr:ABC transporter ATP-binding protein [Candidatus Hydrogenedentota bacterium]
MTAGIEHRTTPRSAHSTLSVARLKRTVKLGLKSLWNHRLRSLLTALGVVFGVCSVVAMLAIGEGASFEAQEQIRRLGSNNIILRAVKPPEEKTSTSQQTRLAEYGLTYADIDRIRDTVPGVEIEVPGRIIRRDVWNGPNRVDCEIYGTVPWYPLVNNHHVARGRFFNRIELDGKANVCVIGSGMAAALFPLDSPIGRRVRAGSQYYRVIGVMEPKSARATTGALSGKARQETRGAAAAHRMFIP